MRADQAGLQADGFLEQAGALIEPLLLKSDGAQYRMGCSARLRVRQRELCLRLGLFEAALLHQVRRALQRVAAVGSCGCGSRGCGTVLLPASSGPRVSAWDRGCDQERTGQDRGRRGADSPVLAV